MFSKIENSFISVGPEAVHTYSGDKQADLNDILEEVVVLLVPDVQEGVRIHLDLGARPLLTEVESEQVFWTAYHLVRHILKFVGFKRDKTSDALTIKSGRLPTCVYFDISGVANSKLDFLDGVKNDCTTGQAESDKGRINNRIEKLGGKLITDAGGGIDDAFHFRVELPRVDHLSNHHCEWI